MWKIGTPSFESWNAQACITRLACCGAAEFHQLGGYTATCGTEGVVYKIADLFAQQFINGCFIFFTQVKGASNGAYGDQLADFVLSNALGKIVKSNEKVNPNSSNTLTAFIWEVDRSALKAWYIKKGVSAVIKVRQETDPGYYNPDWKPTDVVIQNANLGNAQARFAAALNSIDAMIPNGPVGPPANQQVHVDAAGNPVYIAGAAAGQPVYTGPIYDGNRLV